MSFAVYDLDGTVICSKHRHATKPDGSLDLEHWVQNSTPQKIAQDSLLPLVNQLRTDYAKGKRIIICTARVMSRHDYVFLRNNNIPFDWAISRPKTCSLPDAEHKRLRLEKFRSRIGFAAHKTDFYDDNDSVLAMAKSLGYNVKDAKRLNYARD